MQRKFENCKYPLRVLFFNFNYQTFFLSFLKKMAAPSWLDWRKTAQWTDPFQWEQKLKQGDILWIFVHSLKKFSQKTVKISIKSIFVKSRKSFGILGHNLTDMITFETFFVGLRSTTQFQKVWQKMTISKSSWALQEGLSIAHDDYTRHW